ncbi:MAG: hypothetical protein ABI051_11215 [Vicinamibacterales bacterium]
MTPRVGARPAVLALLWLVVAAAVWNGFFDLYVSRGAREYLQLQAEFELGRGPQPAMAEVMARASHDGVRGASVWALFVLGCGWATLALRRGGASEAATKRTT